jgi:hypothetical protein
MVDLFVVTSLDQLLFVLKMLFALIYRTSYLHEEANCTEPSPPVGAPCLYLPFVCCSKKELPVGRRFPWCRPNFNVIKLIFFVTG